IPVFRDAPVYDAEQVEPGGGIGLARPVRVGVFGLEDLQHEVVFCQRGHQRVAQRSLDLTVFQGGKVVDGSLPAGSHRRVVLQVVLGEVEAGQFLAACVDQVAPHVVDQALVGGQGGTG